MEATVSQPVTWQPMSIGEDEVIPIAVAVMDPDGVYRFSSSTTTSSRATEYQQIPSTQQPTPSAPVLPMSPDGQAIVHDDHRAVVASNYTGAQESRRIEQRVLQSNFDQVHDLTVNPDITVLDPTILKYNPILSAEEERLAAKMREGTTATAPVAKRNGYQISEYTSIYENSSTGESSSGYQISEYKSIYDP